MHISLINSVQIWNYSYRSVLVIVIWLIFFINWYCLRYFKTFGKGKIFNDYRCKYFRIFLNEFSSLTLYALIFRFGTRLTKNSFKVLASTFSDVITIDFSIREIVLHVLSLFPNIGFTVFQNLIVSVTFCKSKFS